MSELTILLGAIVLILIVVMYNRPNSSCDEYITYFDQMYYDQPAQVDKVTLDKSVSDGIASNLNEISNTPGSRGVMSNEANTNIVGNKWVPIMDHPGIDDSGRVQYDCLDNQNIPQALTDRLMLEVGKNPRSSSVTQRGAVITEGFADDAWLDSSFKFNDKYNYTSTDLSADLHETAHVESTTDWHATAPTKSPANDAPISESYNMGDSARLPIIQPSQRPNMLHLDPVRAAICKRTNDRKKDRMSWF
jgi:hypothetical protein